MKTLPLYLAAAGVLVACSNDEVVTSSGSSSTDDIRFTTSVDAPSRGTSIDNASALTSFSVLAVRNNNYYQWDTDDGTLTFSTTDGTNYNAELPENPTFDARWPVGQTLRFYATNVTESSPEVETTGLSTSHLTLGTNADTPPSIKFFPKMNVPEQEDLVYAVNKGKKSDFTDGTVPFNFKHALVQIEVKAKNSNPAYTVKVKGYRIHFTYCYATFTFPTATKLATTAEAQASTAVGTWSDFGNYSTGAADYYSGFYKGYTTSGTGLSDTGTDNYILLDGTEKTIRSDTDNGLAMILPTGSSQLTHFGSAKTTNKEGFAIELLVQIDDAMGNPIYPACERGSLTRRISYKGLPKYYGYIYKVVDATFNTDYMGKKVTFLFDLSEAIGYVDNADNGLKGGTTIGNHTFTTVDATASDYNAEDGTGPTGGTDPYTFTNAVLGTQMQSTLTMTIGDWEEDEGNGEGGANRLQF